MISNSRLLRSGWRILGVDVGELSQQNIPVTLGHRIHQDGYGRFRRIRRAAEFKQAKHVLFIINESVNAIEHGEACCFVSLDGGIKRINREQRRLVVSDSIDNLYFDRCKFPPSQAVL